LDSPFFTPSLKIGWVDFFMMKDFYENVSAIHVFCAHGW